MYRNLYVLLILFCSQSEIRRQKKRRKEQRALANRDCIPDLAESGDYFTTENMPRYARYMGYIATSPQRTCPYMPGTWGTDYFTTENMPRYARYMGYIGRVPSYTALHHCIHTQNNL